MPNPADHRAPWDGDRLPQGEAKVQAVRAMFDAIAPRYDLVNRVMTFRLDVRWRRLAVASLGLPPGSLVLDLASGTGDLCVELAAPGHRPISVDLSFGMLRPIAAVRRGCRPTSSGSRCPTASVDGVTCGFALRNLVELGAFFDELARVVRPGGRIALLDVATPPNPVLRLGPRRLLRQGRAPDRWPAVRSRRLPVPAEERRVPPRAPAEMLDRSARPASRPSSAGCCRAASPSSSRGPGQ